MAIDSTKNENLKEFGIISGEILEVVLIICCYTSFISPIYNSRILIFNLRYFFCFYKCQAAGSFEKFYSGILLYKQYSFSTYVDVACEFMVGDTFYFFSSFFFV